jgi:hypothetical protein
MRAFAFAVDEVESCVDEWCEVATVEGVREACPPADEEAILQMVEAAPTRGTEHGLRRMQVHPLSAREAHAFDVRHAESSM